MSAPREPEAGFGPDVASEADRPPLAPEGTGAGLVRLDQVGTAVIVAASAAAAVAPEVFTAPLVVVALAALAIGIGAFLWAYAIAIGRSRVDAIGMGGLFFLAGSAPRRVQRAFLVCLAVQVVATIVAASVRPFTPVAFAVLAPMFGLGLGGLWAARHGAFPPRLVGRRSRRATPPE